MPPDVEPVSLPVQIAQESGGNVEVIRAFGMVLITGDRTFRARPNFNKNDTAATPDPTALTREPEVAFPQTPLPVWTLMGTV